MKRFICLLIAVLLLCSVFSGCAAIDDGDETEIVCTVFPIYDWLRNIVGDEREGVTLTLLVKNGTDPHSYTPSPADIARISSCDIMVYVGGESDAWVSEVLENNGNKDLREVKLLELLGDRAFAEELPEGAEHHHSEEGKHTENAYDEHIWLSLKNAEFICEKLRDLLCEEIEDNAQSYKDNAHSYIAKIKELDGRYETAVREAEGDTLLFADRFPFRYLTEDYGIKYFAAFSGCSADSEASFGTVTSLAEKLDELSLSCVIILEASDRSLAETVIASTAAKNAEIIVMDSMQSISSADIENGVDYLKIMEENLKAVIAALA